MKLKPTDWLGYSADTDTDDARWRAARRLGCGVDEMEVESNGGAVLVRRKGDGDDERKRRHARNVALHWHILDV